MNDLTSTIKLLWGDIETLHMPLEIVEELLGPFGAGGVSSKDYRFRVVLKSDTEDFEFDGDANDWRLLLLEISINQNLSEIHNDLSRQLEVIQSHVKRLRCDFESLLDPQRGVSDDSKS